MVWSKFACRVRSVSFGVSHGPPCQLERLPTSFAGDLPGCALSGDVGHREGLFQPDQRKTGHRIKYIKVDADTGEEVASEDIMKGYKVDTDSYIEVSKEELDDLALESTRTIEIDEFVPKSDIDNRYLIRPYYLVPDGKVGHDAFAVIRETIRNMNKGCDRAGRADQSRAHHRAGAARQGADGNAVALPLRGAQRERIFRRYPGRQSHQGHAGSRQAHRREEIRFLRTRTIRGSLRVGADRSHQPEAQWHADHGKGRAEISRQCHQPDGCAEAQPCERKTICPSRDCYQGKKPRKRIEGQREMLLPISGKREAKETVKEVAKEEAKVQPRKADKPARASSRAKKAG